MNELDTVFAAEPAASELSAAAPVPAFSLICTFCLLISLAFQAFAQGGDSAHEQTLTADLRVLYVYDEVNEQSAPYIDRFRSALTSSGLAFDEAAAADLMSGKSGEAPKVDLASYDRIIVHGMVMAFNSKSPVRDWLKKKPDLSGKKVSLFVTANRWFLDNLYGQLTDLFEKDGAELVDAVSMATKNSTDSDERAAVEAQVVRFAGK